MLAAFHFYAHVVLFHAAVRVRGELFAEQFGVPPANPGVSTSGHESYTQPAERLRYLAEQLLGQLAKDLTPAGRRFVCWQLDAIAPLTGSRLAATAVDPPAVRHAHPHEGYKHANGIVTRPDLESGSLFAFNPKRGTLHVLNLAAWVAFELCDSRDLAALRSSYAGIVASKLTTHGAASHLDNALAQLHEAGLITPVDERAPVR